MASVKEATRKKFEDGIDSGRLLVEARIGTSPTDESGTEIRKLGAEANQSLTLARQRVIGVIEYSPEVGAESVGLRQLDLPGTTPGAAVPVVPPVPSAVLWGGPVAVSESEGVRGEQWSRVAWVCHGFSNDPPAVNEVFFVQDPKSADGREGTWYTRAPDLCDARDTYPLGRAELTLAAPEGNGEARLVVTGWQDERRLVLKPTAELPGAPWLAEQLVESWAASPGRTPGELALAGKFLGHPCPPVVPSSGSRDCPTCDRCEPGKWGCCVLCGVPPARKYARSAEWTRELWLAYAGLPEVELEPVAYSRPAWLGLASPEQLEALNAERVQLLLARWEALRAEMEAAGIEVGSGIDVMIPPRAWQDSPTAEAAQSALDEEATTGSAEKPRAAKKRGK